MKASKNRRNQQLALSMGMEFSLPALTRQLNRRSKKNPRKHRHHDALRGK